jgi:drug/metabolite transporter (DMT)-like permease
MAGARFLVAGGALLTWLRLRGAAWPTWRQWRMTTIAGTFLLLGGNGIVAWAEQFLPSGVTALLIGVGPLFIVLTEWAWPGGTRPTPLTFAALLLGFAGVVYLAAPWESVGAGRLNAVAVIAILFACASWGVGSIYSRHAKHGADALLAAALQMIGGGCSLVLAAAIHRDFDGFSFANVTARSWVAWAYLICVGSLVGFSTFVWLMKHAPPARVATYAYVNPVVAVFLGWLLLHEPITGRTLIASAIIVAAVAIITTQKLKARS